MFKIPGGDMNKMFPMKYNSENKMLRDVTVTDYQVAWYAFCFYRKHMFVNSSISTLKTSFLPGQLK